MCGINGIVRLDSDAPPVDREELLRTRDAMTSRGPDGEGLWISPRGDVAFGHRRLAIIDLSDAAAQPMASADGRYVIVFNGEIYNYKELRSELQRDGATFRSHSDTEVLLLLFARFGAGMLPKLRGMYAFAIWDEKDRRLFATRDPFGIKPFYYSLEKGVFRFASQVKALEASRAVPLDTDPAGLCGFLLWGSVPEPFTLRRSITALPAGHWIEAGSGGVSRPAAHGAPSDEAPDQTPIDVVEAIDDSIRAHLVSDVPVGVFLSAGIDSALILARAVRHVDPPPTTFTLTFDEFRNTGLDEGPAAAELAGRMGALHVERCVSRSVFDEMWPSAMAAMDQPTIDGLNVYMISHFAREAGFKVVLSGLGGDEIFGSYPSFVDVPRWHRWASASSRLPGVRAIWRGLAPARKSKRPKLAGALKYGGSLAGAYFLRRGLFLPEELPAILGPSIAADGLAAYDPVDDARKALDPPPGDEWTAVHRLESSLYLRNQLLRDADWASMAHSLELRVPFVDTTLHRTLAAARFEPARSIGKAALARRVAPDLPDPTLRRLKSGFMIPAWKPTRPETARLLRWGQQSRARSLEVLKHFGVAPSTPQQRRPSTGGRRSKTEETRVLVSTLPLWGGGVRTMTQFVLECLKQQGMEPVVAYYQPYSIDPALSVPSFMLGRRRVAERVVHTDGLELHEVGAWLPELEFMHYRPTNIWRSLVQSCRYHVSVSGNCLAALPLARTDRPFLSWVATPWREDRRQREERFPVLRRVLDRYLVRPATERLERQVLRSGTVLALSDYTRRQLDGLARSPVVFDVLPSPIETDQFVPDPLAVVEGRVGFSGRLTDPRKNVLLFVEAIGECRRRGLPVTGVLIGGDLPPEARRRVSRLGLESAISVQPPLEREALPAVLKTLDVYLVPSKQEGLCIAALEAMACGCPVVSTRCGGPEEFVRDGETGYLTGFDAQEVATAVERIVRNRPLRDKLSQKAQRLIEERYSRQSSEALFWKAFAATFPGSSHGHHTRHG